MIFLLQVLSMVADSFTRRKEPEKEAPSRNTEPNVPRAAEPSTSREQESRAQYQPSGPLHEQEGIPRHHRRTVPMVSKSAVDERIRFAPLYSQTRGLHRGQR